MLYLIGIIFLSLAIALPVGITTKNQLTSQICCVIAIIDMVLITMIMIGVIIGICNIPLNTRKKGG